MSYAGWARIEPMVYRVAHEFRASKQGPPEMPVLINIRQTGLRIANDSADRRSYEVEIGTFKIFHVARFASEPAVAADGDWCDPEPPRLTAVVRWRTGQSRRFELLDDQTTHRCSPRGQLFVRRSLFSRTSAADEPDLGLSRCAIRA